MTTHQKPTGKALSIPAGLLRSTLTSIAITACFIAVISKLVDSEYIRFTDIGYWIVVMLIAATYIGAICAYRRIKRQRVMVCLIAGGIYYLTLLAVTALFFGGQYESAGITGLIILLSSAAAIFIPIHDNRGRGGRKRKKTNR